MNGDVFIFGVCRDHKLRMWSACKTTNLYFFHSDLLYVHDLHACFPASGDCVMLSDLLGFTAPSDSFQQQGSQNHLIRQVNASEGSNAVSIALFLCLAKHSQFCVVRPAMVDGQYQLNHVATIHAPELDLVDFQVSRDRVWALWTNSEGLPVLRCASFSPGGAASCFGGGPESSAAGPSGATGWTSAALEEPLDPDLLMLEGEDGEDEFDEAAAASGFSRKALQPCIDPRQTYMREIFLPGRFSVQTLAKTIAVNLLLSKHRPISQLNDLFSRSTAAP